MPIHNRDIAEIFEQTADLLEIKGDNPFRIRAYRNAALTIQNLSQDVNELIKQGKDLSELPGIGEDLANKVAGIVKTGKFPVLEKLTKKYPLELCELMKITGLGAKRVKVLYEELNIKNLTDLEKAARKGEIRSLPSFKEKTEKSILEGIKFKTSEAGRIKLYEAEQITNALINYLRQDKRVENIAVAGSNRRQKDTVGDADILISYRSGADIMERFVKYEDVTKVISKGEAKSTVLLRSRFQVDLRLIVKQSFGAALLYFTGSKAHNIAIRKIANKKGLKISEYGVFRGKKRIAGKTEQQVYATIDLPYIEPELRENQGEIEAAQDGKLPNLVKLEDIKGDLHVHTNATDGHNTLEEMANAAQKKGYQYIAISDHSKHVTIAHGFKAKDLTRQIAQIDKLNSKLKNITILKSIELDILEDGSLDLPDDILKELDLTVCAIHYKFNLSKDKQTERVLKAMDNPYFNIFAHPTGRLINERGPYEIDIERIIKAAKQKNCVLELNAYPNRLDLNDIYCHMAKDVGVKIAISTDSHSINDLNFMRFGVGQARRGWLEKGDVINTRSVEQLRKLLKR